MKKTSIKIIIFTLLIFFYFSNFLLQKYILFERNANISRAEELLYVPASNVLKKLVLGYDNFVADLLWIKAVLYFAEHLVTDSKYTWLEHLIGVITDLDPLFERVYLWAGAAYIYNGAEITKESIDRSTHILKKGLNYIKDNWQFYFMIGFNYWFELRDYESGIDYITKASKLPGSPSNLKTLVASILKKTNKKEMAVDWLTEKLLEEELKFVEDNEIKSQIRNQLAYYAGEREKERLFREIEAFVQKYRVSPHSFVPYNFFILLESKSEEEVDLNKFFPSISKYKKFEVY